MATTVDEPGEYAAGSGFTPKDRNLHQPMRTHVIVRKTHKWLGLFVGLQVVILSLSGLYMTVVHIDTIHGDHLIRLHSSKIVDASDLDDPLSVACEADQLQSLADHSGRHRRGMAGGDRLLVAVPHHVAT
jgi:hypothetical protein